MKENLIFALRRTASCVVEESNKKIECTKDRFGDTTMDACKDYEFEKIKLSELNGNSFEIQKKYNGKYVWLLLEQ